MKHGSNIESRTRTKNCASRIENQRCSQKARMYNIKVRKILLVHDKSPRNVSRTRSLSPETLCRDSENFREINYFLHYHSHYHSLYHSLYHSSVIHLIYVYRYNVHSSIVRVIQYQLFEKWNRLLSTLTLRCVPSTHSHPIETSNRTIHKQSDDRYKQSSNNQIISQTIDTIRNLFVIILRQYDEQTQPRSCVTFWEIIHLLSDDTFIDELRSLNLPLEHLFVQTINQSINQTIDQSINQTCLAL